MKDRVTENHAAVDSKAEPGDGPSDRPAILSSAVTNGELSGEELARSLSRAKLLNVTQKDDLILTTFLTGGDGTQDAEVNREGGGATSEEHSSLEDGDSTAVISVRLCVPGMEPMVIQVGKNELVQELHQTLMESEETCHRTCFCLKLGDKTIEAYAEVGSIEGLVDGCSLTVVEDAYTTRQARIHVRHIRELLRMSDGSDGFNSLETVSPSYIDLLLEYGHSERKKPSLSSGNTNISSQQIDCTPPDYVLPSTKLRPLSLLYPNDVEKMPCCLRALHVSAWNPPPGCRKLKGDVLYVFVLTLESKAFHVTCCSRGFFVNQSTDDKFNPEPAEPHILCHSLVDLLCQVSPGFKRNYVYMRKKKRQRAIIDRLLSPVLMFYWFAPVSSVHTSDYLRAEDAYLHRLGFEDVMPGQSRDWNEEVQSSRELPKRTLGQRVMRCRTLHKVYGDFLNACWRGAMNVVHNNVISINPQEEPKMRMYLWNNIFFSLGFDLREHYKSVGGDAAAFVSAKCDLNGVQAYFDADPDGLYMLATAVIDYRGYRITCQSVIPGVLEKEHHADPCVLYGSIDFGATVYSSEKFCKLLENTAKEMHILPHKIRSKKGEVALLLTAAESKGIIGNDDRCYILDFYRQFPPDPHFIENAVVNENSRKHGFPRAHPHVLAQMRPELMDLFVRKKATEFIEIISQNLQVTKSDKGIEDDEKMSWIFFSKDNGSLTISDMVNCIASAQRAITGMPDHPAISVAGEEAEPAAAAASSVVGTEHREAVLLLNGSEAAKLNGNIVRIFEKSEDVSSQSSEKKATEGGSGGETGDEERDGAVATVQNGVVHTEESKSEKPSEASEDGGQVTHVEGLAGFDSVFRVAAKAVYSSKEHEFDMRFNVDCYSMLMDHVSEPGEMEQQKKLLAELADFLIAEQVPKFLDECAEHSLHVFDSRTLSEVLHGRGICIRYLGLLAKLMHDRPTLSYWEKLCKTDIVNRCAKHYFRKYLQPVDAMFVGAAVAHFLNCYLSSKATALPNHSDDAFKRKSKKKGRSLAQGERYGSPEGSAWRRLCSKDLWQAILDEAANYYAFTITETSVDEFCTALEMRKVTMLRNLCIATGIQVKLIDYDLSIGCTLPFNEDSISNLNPVVHRLHVVSIDGSGAYETALRKIEAGNLRAGLDVLAEATHLFTTTYGHVHPTIIKCLRLTARVTFSLNDYANALLHQHRMVQMLERWLGIDASQLIVEYVSMAVYCFANGKSSAALKLLYRSRYLLLMQFGEDHPYMAVIDSNIGVLLYSQGDYNFSILFLQQALKATIRYYGSSSMKVALIHNLMARTLSCRGDYRLALVSEKQSYTVYRKVLGETHQKTAASAERLQQLTDLAVNMQRKMNEISRGNNVSLASILPTRIPCPEMTSVLEALTVINGLSWPFSK